MNTERVPLMNKFILVVLSLILVCLVLLVVRAYQPAAPFADESLAEEVSSSPTLAPPVATRARRPQGIPEAPSPGTISPPVPPTRFPVPTMPAPPTRSSLPVAMPSRPERGEPRPARAVRAESFSPLPPVAGVVVRRSLVAGHASVLGRVTLTGTPPPEIPIDLGPACGRLNPAPVTIRHYVVGRGGGLANVIVYVKDEGTADFAAPTVASQLLDQVGCLFHPYVMAVQTGEPFDIRNSDPEMHNLHFTPRPGGGNPERSVVQLRGRVNTFALHQPELFLRLKCDVHPWMFAYVNVLPGPFFSLTDKDGAFQIPTGLPPGRYTMVARHQRAGEMTREIVVHGLEPQRLDFQLAVPENFSGRAPVTSIR